MTGTVLFVEDEEHVLNSIDRLFADNEVRIMKAVNAREALDIFSTEEIAVVVSDNHMQEINGVDLMYRIKEISPDTQKILMTGHADLITAVDAINKGDVFRFIIKPWDGMVLKQTVHEAVKRYQIIQCMKEDDESALLSLAHTIESRDPYTSGHCKNVARYALMIAEVLNLSEDKVKDLRLGSWLHDCGKIGVPEKILNKNRQLTENEFEIIKNHPQWGADVARQAQLSQQIVNVVLRHHERYDGSGYPSGLEGSDIPYEARIVTIADVYDALRSDRSYRNKFEHEMAIEIMQKMKGIVFDPDLLDVFLCDCLKTET